MRTRRALVSGLCCLAVLGTACGNDKASKTAEATTTSAAPAGPVGPQSYTVVVDAPSTSGTENFAFGTYFPNTLSARPGDTLTFENRSASDPHTVSFGVKADRSDAPALITKKVQPNPVVFGPCVTDTPRADLETCPGAPASALPAYAGKGYWNSGVVLQQPAPAEAGPKSVTVHLAADIPAGSYPYACLLHPFMGGVLNVVAKDSDRLAPEAVTRAADAGVAKAKAAAAALVEPKAETSATGAAVTASWGDQLIGVNRFTPATVTIKAGQSVTWKDGSSWLPHTVSFQPPFKSPEEPNAFLPAGAKSGSRFGGGVAHSGIFGPPPRFPAESFSLTFTKAGTYPYICLLHPGMAGTVVVT